jgi:hypothetical protein
MMNQVGQDILQENKDKKIALSFSGGLDSVAILMSLLQAEGKITLIHMKYLRSQSYGILQEELAKYISKMLGVPIINIPHTIYHGGLDSLSKSKDFEGNLLILGEGMDESYGEHYDKDGNIIYFSNGEFFRARHPVADVLIFFPSRLKCLRRSKGKNGALFIQRHLTKCQQKIKKYDIEFNFFPSHPLFIEFFSKYYKNVKDLFFDKLLTKKYVDEYLGRRYIDIVKEVYKLNKHRVKSPLAEFFYNVRSCD